MRSPSTSVTFARTVAAMYEVTSPADPAPMTTRLRSKCLGRVQPAYTLRRRAQATAALATSGNTPSSTKLPSSAGESTSESFSMLPSCVPAFT